MSAIIDEAIERAEKVQKKIDFKMVTFSLAGRDYGIDIMKVDGISKIDKYTFVPNTYPFVKGVYNLRGDIISIIDLKKMFHISQGLQTKDAETKLENILIIKTKELRIGVIVDSVDKVLGISKESIQPPPALFSEINIQYISGVAENDDQLFIILDTDKIFSEEEETKSEYHQEESSEFEENVESVPAPVVSKTPELNFIIETLKTYKNFNVTEVNRKWIVKRFEQWTQLCKDRSRDPQLVDQDDASEFLKPFNSTDSFNLWSAAYCENLESVFSEKLEGPIDAWNPGCGKGFESYSFACFLKKRYPDNRLKIWANDNNLLEISMATSLVLQENQIPPWMKSAGFIQDAAGGKSFSKVIKDALYFEFHDIKHKNMVPNMNFIIARDLLSYLESEDQKKVLDEFHNKLKTNGLLILGECESIDYPGLSFIGNDNISAYIKE